MNIAHMFRLELRARFFSKRGQKRSTTLSLLEAKRALYGSSGTGRAVAGAVGE